jgi:hypothetical protein
MCVCEEKRSQLDFSEYQDLTTEVCCVSMSTVSRVVREARVRKKGTVKIFGHKLLF